MSVLANFDVSEGTVNTVPVTITFPWRARKIIIINDSSTRNLQFKFNSSESYGTLKAKEEFSAYHHTNTVFLDSPDNGSVPYRVWGFG